MIESRLSRGGIFYSLVIVLSNYIITFGYRAVSLLNSITKMNCLIVHRVIKLLKVKFLNP